MCHSHHFRGILRQLYWLPVLLILMWSNDLPATEVQDAASAAVDDPDAASLPDYSPPERWLLLCCGLPGDDAHRERLTEACQKILAAAQPVLGVAPEHLKCLAGDERMRDALVDHADQLGVCTKQTVADSVEKLIQQVGTDEGCWIVLLGHASLYQGRSQFNVSGPDLDQDQFASWVRPLACREQVVWVTLPVSGFWIKPLKAESRVVISATEADFELTGTEMPYALADVMAGQGEHQRLIDVDQDGSLSLLDLYLATTLEITSRFRSQERLQTEHAQLDDNGDGRGSELQQAYLPAKKEDAEASIDETEVPTGDKSGATASEPPTVIMNQNLDGFQSRQIRVQEPS